MVSCLQPEDLHQVATYQQHPEDFISVAPAQGQKPCSVFQETKAFPYLFPEGKNGFSEKRDTRLALGRYVNCRLFSSDMRFANDPQYIFFSQFITELNNINSSTSIAIRKGGKFSSDGSKITANMITNENQRTKILNSDKGYQFLKTIRGSPAYWEKCLKDLFAMVKQMDIPTWFCSFSAADRRWPEILEAICTQQNIPVPEDPDWTEYCQLINSNPVTACRMFENRVLAFISSVILSPAHPIGKVTDYFYRTEFQSRGWPHIHCLFWCEDAPKFNSADPNNDAFIQHINQYIHCGIPNLDEEPELFEIVSNVQLHSKNHSRSCKKGVQLCRYNFPRPLSTRTFVAVPTSPPDNVPAAVYKKEASDVLAAVWNVLENKDQYQVNSTEEIFSVLKLNQEYYETVHSALASRNTVIFKRDIEDQWVNPYNKFLLKAWNGNMDIQPVLDAYSCIMYIVSYISKAERELGDLLRKAQEEAEEGHMEPVKQLRKLGNVYLHAREISVMEAVYRVCGMNLKQSSREVVFVPADQNACRLTKPVEILKESEGTSDDIWMTNIVDRYLSRPRTAVFENMCLADFASNYKVKGKSNENADSDAAEQEKPCQVYKLLNDKGSVVKRTKPAVIRYTKFNKDKNSEKYYYSLVSMYYPHRLSDFKPPEMETYQEMFDHYSHVILPNMEPFEKLTDELDEAWKQLQEGAPPEDVWANIASNQEQSRIEENEELEEIRDQMKQDYEEIDPDDIPDIGNTQSNTLHSATCKITPTSSKDEYKQMLQSLNENQAKLYYFVKNWAEHNEHGDADPFYIFLTGGAGTGKSHTIRCIFNEVDRTISRKSENAECPVVLLVAYTGTAAYNIGGQTIHSAFHINHCRQLAEDSANTLRAKLQDLQLLIIDEVSMVSVDLLNLIHCRLQQIKKPSRLNSVFGNISVLVVGDFYQIPPIRGKSLISVNNSLTDLWSLFAIWNLTEVVRQRGDTAFIEMLNRVRIKPRDQDLSAEDFNFLKSRIVAKDSPDFPVNVLHIASTHKQLDVINLEQLDKLSHKETLCHLNAADISHDRKTQKTFKRNEPVEAKGSNTTALPPYLTICVGARVMLTQNIDVTDGLTNGQIGTVTAIIKGQMPLGLPAAICVLFDQQKIGSACRSKTKPPLNVNQNSTVITQQTEVVAKSPYQVTRHQFPFVLAWAVTIHKTQGLTTKEAIVSLKGIFKAGMAYVALSRVTSGKGLYLLDTDFDTSVIYSDPKVNKQLQTMAHAETLPEWKNLHVFEDIKDPTKILISSQNCEGYLPHFKDIINSSCIRQSDIIALQETWTASNMTLQSILETHHLEVRHRPNPDGSQCGHVKGGVAILVHQDFDYAVIDTSASNIECIGILIKAPSLSVFSVYRPPDFPLNIFLKELQKLLRCVTTSVIVVAGDFNVNTMKLSSAQLNQALTGYLQVIASPTTRKQTLIDHIYVKNAPVVHCGVVPTYYSYHDTTFLVINGNG